MKYQEDCTETEKLYHLLGERIRCLRRRSHMTQEDLSWKIDSTQKYISRIERGIARPNLFICLKISNALHVSMDTLLHDIAAEKDGWFSDAHAEQALAEELLQVIHRHISNS